MILASPTECLEALNLCLLDITSREYMNTRFRENYHILD
jgi:hypothetical protein